MLGGDGLVGLSLVVVFFSSFLCSCCGFLLLFGIDVLVACLLSDGLFMCACLMYLPGSDGSSYVCA